MSRFVDTHVHIDFYQDPHTIARQYEEQGIFTLFMTYLPELFAKHYHNFKKYKKVRLCLGYHPSMPEKYKFNQLKFIMNLKKTNYIGEVGLDGTSSKKVIKKQIEAFQFIAGACSKNKIMSVHSRKAEKTVLDILVEKKVCFAIFHWYTGPIGFVDKISKNGYYFSVNPNMLKTKRGRSLLKKIPPERILVETDGPFYSTNKGIVQPKDIKNIYKDLECMTGIHNLKKTVFMNFVNLLNDRESADGLV